MAGSSYLPWSSEESQTLMIPKAGSIQLTKKFHVKGFNNIYYCHPSGWRIE